MATRKNIGQSAQSLAAEAERQFSELAGALQSARASLASLNRSLKVPVPAGGSRTVRGSRSKLSIYESAAVHGIGGFLSGQIISAGGDLFGDLDSGGDFLDIFGGDNASDSGSLPGTGGFQPSQSQLAGQLSDASQRAQRIR